MLCSGCLVLWGQLPFQLLLFGFWRHTAQVVDLLFWRPLASMYLRIYAKQLFHIVLGRNLSMHVAKVLPLSLLPNCQSKALQTLLKSGTQSP